MLGAFNEQTPDWLSFFMFTFFTDRDGKMQLAALAQSGFDPLSRTCRFMLTEEAHHMFVGETGVARVIQRTAEAMKDAGIDDPYDIERVRALGVIDLPTIQKKANLHFSLTLDLFGNEISTNAANAFNAGLKGRYREDKLDDDHQLTGVGLPRAAAPRRRDHPRGRARAVRPEHAAARRLRGRRRSRRHPLEPRAGTHRHRTSASPCRMSPSTAASASSAPSTPTPRATSSAPRTGTHARETMLPSADDNLFITSLMQTVPRARRLRRLDRPAAARHRQHARRLRVRSHRSLIRPRYEKVAESGRSDLILRILRFARREPGCDNIARMRVLYHMPLSPYARKVRLVLAEKRLPFELRLEKVWERRPEYLELNPAGTVPTLVEDNGLVVPDSVGHLRIPGRGLSRQQPDGPHPGRTDRGPPPGVPGSTASSPPRSRRIYTAKNTSAG